VLRKRLDYPDLKRAVREQAARFRPSNMLIEDVLSVTQLIQELIREGVYAVTRYEPKMEKPMRLHSVTNTIENGFVYLPTEADWLDVYLRDSRPSQTASMIFWIKD
jgi:predicted phage terminase large subunit-like protein